MELLELVEETLKRKGVSGESRALYRYFIIDIKDGSWFLAKHGDTISVPKDNKGSPWGK